MILLELSSRQKAFHETGDMHYEIKFRKQYTPFTKKANLTREQLADKLGVSYQSVSRWENGTTYPDMELIPSLAGIFEVSTDILFGMPEQEKESAAAWTLKELVKASFENPIDVETVNCLIRDIRRNYLGCKCLYQFWFEVNKHALRMPKILSEVRLTAEAILNGNYGIFIRNTTIRQFAVIEDEDHIESCLNKYASAENISKKELLYWRYTNLGNREKSDFLRQQFLSHHIDQLVGYSSLWHERRDPYDFKKFMQMNRLCLQLLHNVCCCTPDKKHPISGDGTVDCWAEPRIWMEIQEAGCLASSGEKEKALIVIEDTVSLMEKALKITSPTELRCISPWLDKIVWIAQEDWGVFGESTLLEAKEERCIWIHNEDGDCYMLYPTIFYGILSGDEEYTYNQNCRFLDPIRQDERSCIVLTA